MLVHQTANTRSVRTRMRITAAFIAIGAANVISAGAAEAVGWGGANLGWQYYVYGSAYNGLGSPGQCTVAAKSTTCGTFTGYFNIVTNKHSITFDYTPSGVGGTWGGSGLSLPPTIYNGIAINLISTGTIKSVKVDPATNMVGFTGDQRVSFTANQIQVDWQNLPFNSSTIVKLDVKLAKQRGPNTPTIKTMPAAAVAEHPTQKAKLTDNPPRH